MRSGEITILQINDVHGYLEPHSELMWDGEHACFRTLGGYARISGLFGAVREERRGAVLALDNGDTFHGTFPAVQTKGTALVPLLNRLGLDAMTGHWDFAYGPAHLRSLIDRLNYPFLAINCYDQASGTLSFPPTRVVARGGLRIGIIGIAATIVDKTMPPQFSEGIRLTLGNGELPGHIQRLRHEDGVDLVVVLSHLGFPQDVKLAAEVAGIDVLVSGHTHNRLHEPVWINSTVIIQSGCHGSFVGRLDLAVLDGRVKVTRHALIPMDENVASDAAMQEMVEEILRPHRHTLREVVGHTDVALHRGTMLEATMDNLLLAAIAEAAGTHIAFSNGWRYGAPVPPGPVTMNDLWNMIPGNPPVSVVDLTGEDLLAMMEENLDHTFSADPYAQMGGFIKRCTGVNIYAKLENPAGHRIERFFAEGHALDPTRIYAAAFVTSQGIPSRLGRNRRNLDISAVEAMRRYLGKRGAVVPKVAQSVVAV